MNEEQYWELCEACDRLLLAPDSSIERIAISWLHIIREHPVFLTNYEGLFEPTEHVKAIDRQWFQGLRSRAARLRQLGRALRSDGRLWSETKEFPEQVDVLFVSHLLNKSQMDQPDDFYFGELPNELAAQGHSVVIALIKHFDKPSMTFTNRWKESTVPRAILSDSLGFLEEIALYRGLKKESSWLRRSANKEISGLFRRVLVRASEEAISGNSLATLRMAKQIGALVAKLKPKTLVVTHEGYAWERVAFAAARSATPEIQCIGYQHAALFRLQHAIRRNLAVKYNPDQILTAGAISKAQLERAPTLKGVMISVLGSNRSPRAEITSKIDCAHNQRQSKQLDDPACLVLPEGIASECHLLFEFSLACAQTFPEIKFIWRLHPLMTYESLVAKSFMLKKLPKNIVLSQGTLAEDFAKSRWTLYRGTTTVVQAVMAGLRPIYLRLSGELEIDPLYELEVWRTRVTSVSEFERTIRLDIDTCEGLAESDLDLARRHCKSFYLPSNVGALTALIPGKL